MKVIVSGGLGNQMFQYALYLNLKSKGKNVVLDISMYNFNEMHNGYELKNIFNIEEIEYNNKSLYYKYFLKLIYKLKNERLVFHDFGYFNSYVFKYNPCYYCGYWQSELYFNEIKDKLRTTFNFKQLDERNKLFLNQIINTESVSIHVRRGDYIGLDSVSGICDEDYYLKSIKFMNNKLKSPKFYVFSNDISYCKKIFTDSLGEFIYVNINSSSESYKDMCLMSKCNHNIIANSSFSWWAAWLNSNSKKMVIRPKKWVNDNDLKNNDICPNDWLVIN